MIAADPSQERLSASTACSAGTEFVKRYYEQVDKMRHKLSRLYMPDSVLLWNGNRVDGGDAIQKFYQELPVSQHTVRCFDAQPVNSKAVGERPTLLITTAGHVFFKGKRSDFHQAFILTSVDDKWKLVSDNFRFQQYVPTQTS